MEALLAWLNVEPRCRYGRDGCAADGGDHWAGLRVLDIDDAAMSLSHPGPPPSLLGYCSAKENEYNAAHRVRGDYDATWRELPQAAAWLRTVHGDPNRKYAQEYAAELEQSALARERHEALVAEFGTRVREVSGYKLAVADFRWPGAALEPVFSFRDSKEWWGRWCARSAE